MTGASTGRRSTARPEWAAGEQGRLPTESAISGLVAEATAHSGVRPQEFEMRTSSMLISGAVAAVAVAGSANAVIVIDNFTTALSPAITTWNYAGNGACVDGTGPTDLTFGSTGAGILGRRLVCTNSWGAPNTTASATIANGQFVTSLFGGDYADNQMMAQYKFDSAIDMTQAGQTHIYIAGSGSGSASVNGQGYGIGVILFSNLRVNSSDPSAPFATYDMRASVQMDMNGSNSIGNLTFDVMDIVTQNGFTAAEAASINGFAVFQYAYGGDGADAGTWNYTATSFSIVPAPGALALLGVAGLAGFRRRR